MLEYDAKVLSCLIVFELRNYLKENNKLEISLKKKVLICYLKITKEQSKLIINNYDSLFYDKNIFEKTNDLVSKNDSILQNYTEEQKSIIFRDFYDRFKKIAKNNGIIFNKKLKGFQNIHIFYKKSNFSKTLDYISFCILSFTNYICFNTISRLNLYLIENDIDIKYKYHCYFIFSFFVIYQLLKFFIKLSFFILRSVDKYLFKKFNNNEKNNIEPQNDIINSNPVYTNNLLTKTKDYF